MISPGKNKNFYLIYARISDQSELYDEMAEAMVHRCKIPEELSSEERNLLSVSFKNIVGRLRSSARTISAVSEKYPDDEIRQEVVEQLGEKVKTKLNALCQKLDNLINDFVLPNVTTVENKVFFTKMRADYIRYRCEIVSNDECATLFEIAEKYYQEAYDLASDLSYSNVVRLGLVLNYSVFYYEIKGNVEKACALSKIGFDAAMADINNQEDDSPSFTGQDSSVILQLIRDNLMLWASDINNADDFASNNN